MSDAQIKTALTIAGSDCSGGAGIQADIKTMLANGVYAASVITALTAQNTQGVFGIHNVPTDFIAKQIDSVFSDIPPNAVKIGMLSSSEILQCVCEKLCEYKPNNIVTDPVMISTSGHMLLEKGADEFYKKMLFPISTLITPNIPEGQFLSGREISSKEDMENAAKFLSQKCGCAVLLKGGHSVFDASDVLFDGNEITWFSVKKSDNPNTHGTGCTLSSAIAANLAKGEDIKSAVFKAKEYITGAINANLNLGKGSGPLHHGWNLLQKGF